MTSYGPLTNQSVLSGLGCEKCLKPLIISFACLRELTPVSSRISQNWSYVPHGPGQKTTSECEISISTDLSLWQPCRKERCAEILEVTWETSRTGTNMTDGQKDVKILLLI